MFVEELIRKRLEELHPNFNYLHTEHKMYVTAVEDFINYYAVKNKHSVEGARLMIEGEIEERGLDAKQEIDMWMNLWLVTWKKRVKLVFTDEEYNRYTKTVTQLIKKDKTQRNYRNVSYQRIKQFQRPIIECLIQNGELVFTKMLSEEIIKQKLSTYKNPLNNAKGKLDALYFIMRRVRGLSRISGPLIFLKVNKSLFR